MSSATASTPGSAPKSMSSRLLTMKFMQRAAATSPTTANPPDEPSPKRRKKDSDSPSRPKVNVDELADQRAVQAAIAAEEAKRQAALERQGAEAGDTRWVLSFEDQKGSTKSPNLAIRVVQAGYAHLDVPGDSSAQPVKENAPWEERPVMVGRRSYGKFNKVLEKQQNPSLEDDSESEDDEDDDVKNESEESSDEEDDDPTSDLIRATRKQAAERVKAELKAKKKAEKAQSAELARQRKKKEVNLNGMTSLSGRQAPVDERTCFVCGGPHLKSNCPEQKRRFSGPEGGHPKKARTYK